MTELTGTRGYRLEMEVAAAGSENERILMMPKQMSLLTWVKS